MAMLNNQMVYIVFMSTPECMAYFYRWHCWPQAAWLPIWVAQSGKRNSKLWTIVSHSTIYPSLYTIYIPFISIYISFIYHLLPRLRLKTMCYCCHWVLDLPDWYVVTPRVFSTDKTNGAMDSPRFWSKVEHCLQTASLEVHPGGLSGGIPMVTTGWWLGAIPFFRNPEMRKRNSCSIIRTTGA